MKLEGAPGQQSLTTLLGMMGIGNAYLDVTIYHKFMDVYVYMLDDETMEWRFTYDTFAEYNKKDKYGKYVLWGGIETNSFSKCSFILKKRTQSLTDIVAAKNKK